MVLQWETPNTPVHQMGNIINHKHESQKAVWKNFQKELKHRKWAIRIAAEGIFNLDFRERFQIDSGYKETKTLAGKQSGKQG